LLTIGDGLVTQIPALILSTAAGVLVTRVASEEAETPLGDELVRQIFGVPKALQVAGAFVGLLSIVPGLPAFPFLVLGAGLLWVGRERGRARAVEERRAAAEPGPGDRPRARANEPLFVPLVVPWALDLSDDLSWMAEGPGRELYRAATSVREQIFAELGVPLPAPRIRVKAGIGPRRIIVSIQELPADSFELPEGSDSELEVESIRQRVVSLLRRRAADFLGLSEVQRLLDELDQYAPATVRNVVPKPVTLVLLTDVVRRLVEERISIRDLRGILEALSTAAQVEKDPLSLAEYVRSRMNRAITFHLTGGGAHLEVVLLDPIIEDTVRHAVTRSPAGAFLALPPQAARDVLASVRRAFAESGTSRPVILTQPDIRRFVRKLLEPELPEACVISFAELLPEISLKPLARAMPN
jgi:type III secretion protein V